MKEEIITIQQKIKIKYRTDAGRQAAISAVLHDTNFISIMDGWIIKDNPLEYVAHKTNDIILVEQ